ARRHPRSHRGLPPGGNPRLHRGPAAGLSHRGRRKRRRVVRRPEAAHRHRARPAAPPADPDLRRGDLRARSRHRRGLCAHREPPARQRHRAVHRAPRARGPGGGQGGAPGRQWGDDRSIRIAIAEIRNMNLPNLPLPAEHSKSLTRRSVFLPSILQLQEEAPSPLPRVVLWTVFSLVAALGSWAAFGRLDFVAVAEGRLVPKTQLQIVQPAEGGVMRDLLVKEGERVRAGQLLARMDMRSAEADANTAQNEIALRRLQLRRIDAELGGTRLAALPEDPMRLFAQVEAQREARALAHEASLAEQRTVVARARRDMQAALETQGKLSGALPVLVEQERAF